MSIRAKPPADIAIQEPLVLALLQEQHADLSHLPLTDAGDGWDNKLFRLGEDLAVRLPRRAASTALIEHEQRWLPRLAEQLPLPVPVPLRIGRPGCRYPWSWSIVPWFPGQSALVAPPEDLSGTAVTLGRFVGALHRPAPPDAPRNPWRGVPLADRTSALRDHLQRVGGIVEKAAVLALWDRLLSAAPWQRPPMWIHGDLHPGNLMVAGGHLSAVIDFGDLAAGDPATDLSIMWMLLPPEARPAFLVAASGEFDAADADTVKRARAWALALGLAYLANSWNDRALRALGLATVNAALDGADA
jgi:aminoglycoside phosphotransferase (APT) family kinase protein